MLFNKGAKTFKMSELVILFRLFMLIMQLEKSFCGKEEFKFYLH